MDFETFNKLPLGQMLRETKQKEGVFIDNYLQNHLKVKIHRCEGLTLSYIDKHKDKPIRSLDIANEFHLSKATISQTLHQLVDKNLVEFADAKDKRSKEIRLTEHGKNALDDFDCCFMKITRLLERDFTEDEKNEFAVLLYRFSANIDKLIQEGENR